MRRAHVVTVLALIASLAWSAPAAAQGLSGWTVQLEGRAGLFKSTRDIGKILGSEVQAQIKTVLQTAPVYSGGFILKGPSPAYSLRGTVSYMSTDARGQAGACSVVTGPGCATLDFPATSVSGILDVLLHNDQGEAVLKYFIAGVGMRRYTFDEIECRGLVDPILFDVCSPMAEFLANQTGMVGRLGLGVQGRGPIGWSLEVLDQVSQFVGSGERGEGGIQNDLYVTVGFVFPSR